MTPRAALRLGACTVLCWALLVGTAASAGDELHLRFDRLNGAYENLPADVAPFTSSGVTIRLGSPEHRLYLKSNSVHLRRLSGGAHLVTGRARFSGAGSLQAELDLGGAPTVLEDRVQFPDQEQVIEAVVRIERVEDGYRVTAERLPPHVEIEMRSRLGAELVSWCERLALFVAGDAGCPTLELRLARPRLPLPKPGADYVVTFDELTAEERALVDEYLGNR